VCDLPDPYEHAVESERAAMAKDLLAGFSAKDRTFASLYFGEELDPQEIATRMQISVKTVYSKKHKIQARLESALGAPLSDGKSAAIERSAEVLAARLPLPHRGDDDEAPASPDESGTVRAIRPHAIIAA
jgi:hypothetical protein